MTPTPKNLNESNEELANVTPEKQSDFVYSLTTEQRRIFAAINQGQAKEIEQLKRAIQINVEDHHKYVKAALDGERHSMETFKANGELLEQLTAAQSKIAELEQLLSGKTDPKSASACK